MELQTFYKLPHREYANKQCIFRILLSFTILTIGGMIYVAYRDKSLLMFTWFEQIGIGNEINTFRELVNSEGVYGWVKNSLPDGLWLFSYMFLVDTIWNGTKNISSFIFIYSLPILAIISEFLQYNNLCPGTFDWLDLVSYTFTILLFISLKIIK